MTCPSWLPICSPRLCTHSPMPGRPRPRAIVAPIDKASIKNARTIEPRANELSRWMGDRLQFLNFQAPLLQCAEHALEPPLLAGDVEARRPRAIEEGNAHQDCGKRLLFPAFFRKQRLDCLGQMSEVCKTKRGRQIRQGSCVDGARRERKPYVREGHLPSVLEQQHQIRGW